MGAYPDLFSLPTQTTSGLSLSASDTLVFWKKRLNQIRERLQGNLIKGKPSYNVQFFDWNFELRNSQRLQTLVKKQLSDLSSRDLITWLNVESLLTAHVSRRKNYGEEIRILVSLEIFLKADENGKE